VLAYRLLAGEVQYRILGFSEQQEEMAGNSSAPQVHSDWKSWLAALF